MRVVFETVFEADDETLKTSDTIADAVVYYFELLAPLYNAMVWRPPVNNKLCPAVTMKSLAGNN